MTDTIKTNLNLSQEDIANSNVIALTATLLVRLAAGPLCDRFGARLTFAGILLVGAIPTALAGTVSTPQGLITIRFFIGILGGSFVPCQVWTTAFFDKNIVGTANSLVAGFGNAGSGVTYFVMPALFDSLVQRRHLSDDVAWRVAFVIPFILITLTALVMILTCPDTPTGAWSARTQEVQRHLDMRDTFFDSGVGPNRKGITPSTDSVASPGLSNDTIKLNPTRDNHPETQVLEDDLLAAASWELVEKPTVKGSTTAIFSLSTLAVSVAYFCSFGTELCVNSFLGAYYAKKVPSLGQTGSGDYAAMFGLLNFVFRPAGGIISDTIYRRTRSLWAKKILIHAFGVMTVLFLFFNALLGPLKKPALVGLITGLSFFVEAGNGAIFSLVPHVHPTQNGRSRHV